MRVLDDFYDKSYPEFVPLRAQVSHLSFWLLGVYRNNQIPHCAYLLVGSLTLYNCMYRASSRDYGVKLSPGKHIQGDKRRDRGDYVPLGHSGASP
ncbi:hypothetical protein GBAR_LOCUS6323, partial [Geodia barretti]